MPLTIKCNVNTSDKHENDITCLIYYKDRLFSGADDGKIKVWNENLQLLTQATAHPCSIFSLAVGDNSVIYSCSNEGTVKVWGIPNLQPLLILLQEQNEMWKVCFNNGKLYVGDDAGKVYVFSNNKMVGILEIMHPITELLAIDNMIYTARDLYVIISETFPEEKRIVTLQALVGRAPICVVGEKLCFASRNGRDILVHDNSRKSDFQLVGQVKDAHEMILNALWAIIVDGEEYIYSGGWDKILKKWKINETDGSLKMIDSCPIDICITSICAGPNNGIYVGGADGHIFLIQQ